MPIFPRQHCVKKVQQNNQIHAKSAAIPALWEYWLTDRCGGLFFPVYLLKDYKVKPGDLSQPRSHPDVGEVGDARPAQSLRILS